MRTWETCLRLVSSKDASPFLIGLVVEELEQAVVGLQRKRSKHGLSRSEEIALRNYLLKRYLLMKKLTSLLEASNASGACV